MASKTLWALAMAAIVAVGSISGAQAAIVERVEEAAQAPRSGPEALERFAQLVHTASGQFEQRMLDKNGQSLDTPMRGHFVFERPGRFVWHTDSPYEQHIVSNGTTLWIWDPDLNQVTVKHIAGQVQSTPAGVLFGQGDLAEVFDLLALPASQGLAWVQCTPKQEDPTYARLNLGFDAQGRPAAMDLLDHFGQTTQLRLTQLRINAPVDKTLFEWRAPAGADVLRDTN